MSAPHPGRPPGGPPGGPHGRPPARRAWPVVLLVVFVVLPVIEIWAILRVGSVIGAGWTVVLLVADSLLGAWLLRREGARTFRALQDALARGSAPGRELADGALVVVGGTLLLTPGFVTDVLGIVLLLPLTRPLARRLLLAAVASRVRVGVTGPGAAPYGARPDAPRPRPDAGRGGPVVPGEVVDES